MESKFRLIFIPFLLIAITFIAIYTFLHWFVLIDRQFFVLDDDLVNLWLPLIFSSLLSFFVLSRRINLLKQFGRDGLSVIKIVVALSISTPTSIAQVYLQQSTGQLTHLNYISDIYRPTNTTYYTVNNFYADKNNIGIYSTSETSGRLGARLTYTLFIAVPLFDKVSDTSYTNVKAWLAIDYYKTTFSYLGQNKLNVIFNSFFNESIKDFKSKYSSRFIYLEKLSTDRYTNDYIEAAKRSSKYMNGDSIIILEPFNEAFNSRTGYELPWIFISFGIGVFILTLFLMNVDFDQEKLSKVKF